MKLLGSIDEGLDLVNKDYVDNSGGGSQQVFYITGTYNSSNAFDLAERKKGIYCFIDGFRYFTVKYGTSTLQAVSYFERPQAVLYVPEDIPAYSDNTYSSGDLLCYLYYDVDGSTSGGGVTYSSTNLTQVLIQYNSTGGISKSSNTNYSSSQNYISATVAQTLNNQLTFLTLPKSSVVPTNNDHLVNKKYVDDNAGGGHTIEDSTGTAMTDRSNLQFIGADIVDDSVNDATQVITPTFREIQGDIPDTPVVCLDGAPIGTITQYGAPISTLDANWLPCLGQAVSRTLYHELFEKIGITYGSGDGTTTFNVPNYGGRIPVGLDSNDTDFDTLGDTLGEKKHSLSETELPYIEGYFPHVAYGESKIGGHTTFVSNRPSNYEGQQATVRNTSGYKYAFGNSNETTRAHNNIQPSIVTNYIIKAKQASTAVLQGTINNTYNDKINEVYSSSYINSNVDSKFNYSTNLSIVGYWINNKPIYRKVFSSITLPSTTAWTNICNMSSDNVEDIINIYGTFKGSDGRQMMIQQTEDGANVTASYLNGYIQIKTAYSSWYSKLGFLIVEYTKTTD